MRVTSFVLKSKRDVTLIQIISDNQSAINMSIKENINRRNKDIYMSYHYVRYVVGQKVVFLQYKPRADLTVDFLTKAPVRVAFERHRANCGLVSKEEFSGAEK